MNCKICYNAYDHSIRKPFMLSCPHTFCLSCINELKRNSCPTCDNEIKYKNPNIALLSLIPESLYDQLKAEFEKTLNEITEMKIEINKSYETKLNCYLNKLDSIKNSIKNKTSEFINLVKANETELLNEATKIEQLVTINFTPYQEDLDKVEELYPWRPSVQNNTLNEAQLLKLADDSKVIKAKLNHIADQIENYNENIELTVRENISSKDGSIFEITTSEKVKILIFS